ncbi:HTH-type transcriptional regulator DegA [Capsulimonas corticalis]|uniref:HTH-type transcriptional regulator DegA n=1 Tax=Capsulimonas corticalis TaxID=2219043 RepID=A0A402CVK9_9BACT|nr:LacI family DNA-binding transcriptional regulator [Capsulimonas corticalis]BDI30436.1 HTH-type transcriptional regulator DegA [Capsulimonas corticalis]
MKSVREENNRVTLKDVAKRVGVSYNAVSKVLNQTRSNTAVSESTRARILEVAAEMGYQPNILARSLLNRRTNITALYFDLLLHTDEPFTSSVIAGAERGCQAYGQSLLLYSRRPNQTAQEVHQQLVNGLVDGIVLAAYSDPVLLQLLENAHVPVAVYPYPTLSFPSVAADEMAGARAVMQHLKERGHTDIVYRAFPWIEESRSACFRAASEALGLRMTKVLAADASGNISREERELYHRPRADRPTAVVCWNDEFAYRLLDYLDDERIRVPDDLAVVGFDGSYTFPKPKRKLSTVFVPWNDMAYHAVSMVTEHEGRQSMEEHLTFPVELIVGHTT